MAKFERVEYADLNARQKENYNSHKIAASLADYGFNLIRLTDDWQGADAIADHRDGKTFVRVQIKSRFTLSQKYKGKDIWIAFIYRNKDETPEFFLYPHDKLLEKNYQTLKIRSLGQKLSLTAGVIFQKRIKSSSTLIKDSPLYFLSKLSIFRRMKTGQAVVA